MPCSLDADMKPGQHSIIETNAEYGFSSACEMPRPRGVPAGRELEAEIELLHTMPSRQVLYQKDCHMCCRTDITAAIAN